MKSTRRYILLILLLLFSVGVFSQATEKYDWESIPAHQSLKQLKIFQAIYEDKTNIENWDEAQRLAFLTKGMEAAEALQAKAEMLFFSIRLGNRYYALDSFSQAIHYLKYPVNLKIDTITVARAYNQVGYLYFDLGDYNKALEHLFEAVRYGKMLNRGWETYPFGNISNVYKHLEDYDNAIKYTKGSIEIDLRAASPEREYGLVYNYTALLVLSADNNQLDSCFRYIELLNENITVIDTIVNVNYEAAVDYAHITIADFYIKNNLLDKAKIHLDLAQKNRDYNVEEILTTSTRYYLKKQDYPRAKSLIEDLDALNLQNFQALADILQLKIDYYTATNDLKTVIAIQKELLETQKEKFGNDRLRYGTFASAEFRNIEQKEKIATLEKRRAIDQLRSRNRTFAAFTAFLIIIGIAIFLWNQSKQRRKYSQILEQKVAERTIELQTANKNLEQANYELRTFNYIASHDIKEPIRNVGNYVGLIFRKLPEELKNSLKPYFETIKKNTSQLYTLVEDFARYTTLSRNEAIRKQEVNLNELVESIETGLHERIERSNGKVIYSNLPIIQSNTSLLYTALKNLIENGLKYNQSAQPTVNIDCQLTNEHYEITMSDNGIGISEEYHEQIFEMFKRLHHRGDYEGSGIGLAIVKLVMDKLEGKVEVKSSDAGSEFILQIPNTSKVDF